MSLTYKWQRSSLFCNLSVRHERHECGTNDTSATWVRHAQYECKTTATRVLHECDTSATRTKRVRHECYTNDTSAIRVKNFVFDNETNEENIFSHPYISYVANERLQGEEQFHSKNYLLEMHGFHAKCVRKVHHKNWTL